jgi:FkbM family methyltransferase
VHWLAPKLAEKPEVVVIGGIRIELDTTAAATQAMYYGIYEEHLINWIARNIRPSDSVIEPGMNVGFVTAHLLRQVGPSGLVIALEPSRRCVEKIQSCNDLPGVTSLHVLNAAVADRDGSEMFYETTNIIDQGYGCLQSANWSGRLDGQVYEVPLRTVDSLMQDHGLSHVRFLKLDVEGSELRALHGASRALSTRAIDHIMVETYIDLDDAKSEASRAEMWSILESSGFRPFWMARNGTVSPFAILSTGPRKFMRDVMWSLRC